MYLPLEHKAAIVTGGASGIGYSIVKGLARAGASVIIADMNEQGAEAAEALVQEGLNVTFVQGDITLSADAQRIASKAVEHLGGLDILVNNAGIYPRSMMQDTTEELWDRVMSINLKGVFLMCQAAVPWLKKRGGGAIINMSSSHAAIGSPELFAYAVSKGGISTLTRNLAGALTRDRIRVNAINPGWVATEREIEVRALDGQTYEWLVERGKMLPLGRLQTGEDSAGVAVFLASDHASQITGQIIQIDGGNEVS
ncbi:Enoyl-(Acyl carrier protein) reductase [Paenibacillus sp. 1_12]|uniref:SDR family NAD(P)-dependent oxidoreductase n=1 Tax=Paenibacillus sp. 1_12 TaxID=1566278 RepID=UPI0008F0CC98|nr:SDR family oxidoreductase [Paenibacillus sp. 1_12]SFM12739.1 Enoyl-(Acyl carrier protein) reductase [Paenibacillus sp. 1_12]